MQSSINMFFLRPPRLLVASVLAATLMFSGCADEEPPEDDAGNEDSDNDSGTNDPDGADGADENTGTDPSDAGDTDGGDSGDTTDGGDTDDEGDTDDGGTDDGDDTGDDGDTDEPPPPPTTPACVQDLFEGGQSTLCASCACGRCPEPAQACGGEGAPHAKACMDLIACQHRNGCVGEACYCGEGLAAITCDLTPAGPCVDEFETAAGVTGRAAINEVIASDDPDNPLVLAHRLATCTLSPHCATQCGPAGDTCTFEHEACQDRYCRLDHAKEQARAESALLTGDPSIAEIHVNGTLEWVAGQTEPPVLRPGDTVALVGTHFGGGPDIDFSKILIGNSRVLERDLAMYEQELDITTEVHHELPTAHDTWPSDVVHWDNERIEFTVPQHVSDGPLRLSVQKRTGANASLLRPGQPHLVIDALTKRIIDQSFSHTCDVVSELGPPRLSAAIPVAVENPGLADLVQHGQRVFWSFDFNIGLTHKFRGLDWAAIFAYETTDPMTGEIAEPYELFGALPTLEGEVPAAALDDVHFEAYPQTNPVPGFLLTPQTTGGWTRNTGWVGYRYAESSHPFEGPGEWIGFNCASCHGVRITYERAPGESVTTVVPGLPNPDWSMKWSLLGEFEGIVGSEPGPMWAPGDAEIDKTSLIYAMPPGTGEHTMVRWLGEGSHTDNDYQFSPIVIPNVTHHTPVRRPLSHTESYVGFEGSYIHSEEPDGALGSMRADDLLALTAYMVQLDGLDDDLRNVGLYRWLVYTDQLALAGDVEEGSFVANGWQSFDDLSARIDDGHAVFAERCGDCHQDGFAAHTDERMFRLDEVGRFFEPTPYHEHVQSIRTAYLRNLYWVQHRGLLSDGHVRNLQDLVDPARCEEGSPLYDRYYTLHEPEDPGPAGPDFPDLHPGASPRGDVFRVARFPETDEIGQARNRFVERYKYFVPVDWDPDHYYWDFQKMRAEYGPDEIATAEPVGLPATPHPWCAQPGDDTDALLLYLLTL